MIERFLPVRTALTQEQACAPDLQKRVIAHYTALAPMTDWLCGALDLDF